MVHSSNLAGSDSSSKLTFYELWHLASSWSDQTRLSPRVASQIQTSPGRLAESKQNASESTDSTRTPLLTVASAIAHPTSLATSVGVWGGHNSTKSLGTEPFPASPSTLLKIPRPQPMKAACNSNGWPLEPCKIIASSLMS